MSETDTMLGVVEQVNEVNGVGTEPIGGTFVHLWTTGYYGAIILPEKVLWDTEDENDGGNVSTAKVAARLRDYADSLLAACDVIERKGPNHA